MSYFVNPYATAGYLAVVAAWTMACVVYFSAPARTQTRSLALLLFFEGMGCLGGFAAMWSTTDPADAIAWQMVGMVGFAFGPLAYLLFISTLETPLARPLRTRAARLAILAITLVGFFVMLLNPDRIAAGVIAVWWAPWEVVPGPWFTIILMLGGAPSVYAIAATFDARRRTPSGTDARRRANLYLAAFGVHDLVWGLLYFSSPLWFQRIAPLSDAFVIWVLPGSAALFSLLLAYGVLRAQLFDIDLRVRWTVSRTTTATVFLAVFFVAAQLAQNFLATAMGWVVGGVAAGLLLFALSPVQRVAERVAATAVPAQRTTPEYLAFRKLEVYKAAVESAYETGGMTDRERQMLDRLRAKLRLEASDAQAIERDVRGVPG